MVWAEERGLGERIYVCRQFMQQEVKNEEHYLLRTVGIWQRRGR